MAKYVFSGLELNEAAVIGLDAKGLIPRLPEGYVWDWDWDLINPSDSTTGQLTLTARPKAQPKPEPKK